MSFDERVKSNFRERAREIEALLVRKGTDAFKKDPKQFLSEVNIEITSEQAEAIQKQLITEESKKELLTASAALSVIYIIM